MSWVPCSERVPVADNQELGFCLESAVVLIQTQHGEHYTARYRVMLDDAFEHPEPTLPPRWILEGQDGYDLRLEIVAAWQPIEPYLKS